MEISSLSGTWLDITCHCGRNCTYPLKLMAQRHHPGLTLWSVVTRLRCKHCRKRRPRAVVLSDTPHRDNAGMAGANIGWKIDLLKGR